MANIYDMVDTWNDGATTFTAIKMNVTDTASASDSMLMDLQVGGTSQFKVDKVGAVTAGPSSGTGSLLKSNYNGGTHFGFNTSASQRSLEIISWNGSAAIFSSFSPVTRLRGPVSIGGGTGDTDVQLARDAANTLAQRNSTNAQTFNLYNTYTSSDDHERGFMRWNSNVLEIGTEKGVAGGDPRAVKYYFDSQYSSLTGRADGYVVDFETRYGREFTTSSHGVVFLRQIGLSLVGTPSNPTRIRPTAKNTTPALPIAGTADLHIEAGYGYVSSPPGSSIKIAAGYGGTPAAEGAGGAGGSLKFWIGEGGEQNTSGGKGADGTFEVLGVSNAGTFGTAPVFSVDYSGNVLMGTNQAPAVKSDTTQAGANTASINNIVTVTQAEYDLLTPDADTVYFITA